MFATNKCVVCTHDIVDYWLHFIDNFIEFMNNFHVSLDVGYAVVRLMDPYKYFTSTTIERKKHCKSPVMSITSVNAINVMKIQNIYL